MLNTAEMSHLEAEISEPADEEAPAGTWPRFRPIEFRPLTDQIYEALRQSMLDGELHPGERLDTRRIAQDFGVSQAPVRHAVAMLAKDGLLEVRPRSGTFVENLTAGHLSEIMDIRRALELLACESAVKEVKETDIAHLRRFIREIRESVDPREVSQSAAKFHDLLNTAFHEAFVNLSGNKRLVQLYSTLEVHQHMARVHARFSDWGKSVTTEADQHSAIVAALEDRNLDRLRRAVKRHVRYSRALLMNAVNTEHQKSGGGLRNFTGSVSGKETVLQKGGGQK
ncbi:MAG: GntR family transcriptional regulator [Verrucomicrobia bacterium]|nr:GntR family transcriptional regulator [Verrucomicrobiota bacterium]